MKTTKTKITQEREQFRTTIPKELMEKSNHKKGDVAEWSIRGGKLNAKVLTHKEFMEKIKEVARKPTLREQTKDAFCEVEE